MRFPAFLLGLLLSVTPPLHAQGFLDGSLQGEVLSSAGVPISAVEVSLSPDGQEPLLLGRTDREGRFAFAFIPPGRYSVRVEALGYLPTVVRPLDVAVSGQRTVRVTLEEARGVVARVDTVAPAEGGRVRSAGRVSFPRRLVGEIPSATGSLRELASLFPEVDLELGVRGLPASALDLMVDGISVPLTRHPQLRDGPGASPLATQTTTGGLQSFAAPPDIELMGASTLSLLSPARRTGSGSFVHGGWSGDALWNSGTLDFETPSLMSGWAGAGFAQRLAESGTDLVVQGDGVRLQTPRAPRIDGMGSGDPELPAFMAPSVHTLTRASGFLGLEGADASGRSFAVRGRVGRSERSYEGPGAATLAPGEPLEGTATDFALAGQLLDRSRESVILEVRGGLSSSARTFGGDDPTPQALVVGPGWTLGAPAGLPGEVSRFDADLAGIVHHSTGEAAWVKGGIRARGGWHSNRHSFASGGRYLFTDADALESGRGASVLSTRPDASFFETELSAFAQYDWSPRPALRVSVGARLDYLYLVQTPTSNADLQDATGLDSGELPRSFPLPAANMALVWELAGPDGGVSLLAATSLRHGTLDPALVGEIHANDGAVTVRRTTDASTGWPNPTNTGGTTRPVFSLFGPDMRPPRHLQAEAGLRARVSAGTSLHLVGSVRRSDFLPRRRNLNLAALPAGTLGDGRAFWGDLTKDGGWVRVDGMSHRRFTGLDDVWALDPDGFSDYRGVTVGLEHESGPVFLYASYTRSSTEDNWFGAAGGPLESSQRPKLDPDDEAGLWTEGVSDFDVPDRARVAAVLHPLPAVTLAAGYRFSSGRPFTPGYRAGVDVNGDGSGFNDPAFVPAVGELGSLVNDWSCLQEMAGGVATRNGCRGPDRHQFDLHLGIRLTSVGSLGVELNVSGFNLMESDDGLRDNALLLVDPDRPLGAGPAGQISVPTLVNPDFGRLMVPFSPGRLLRVGIRIGS